MIPARYCDICDNLVHFDEPKNTCTKGECIFCVRFVTFLRNRCTFCSKSWTFVQILTVKQYFCFLKNMKPAVKTEFYRSEKHGFLFRKHLFLVQISFSRKILFKFHGQQLPPLCKLLHFLFKIVVFSRDTHRKTVFLFLEKMESA